MKMSDWFIDGVPLMERELIDAGWDGNRASAIVHAVNCHDDLVAALEVALDVMNYVDGENDCSRAIEAAELALAKTRGE